MSRRVALPADHRRLTLAPGRPDNITNALAFVQRTLDAWTGGARPHAPDARRTYDDIVLVVCELVANACAHTSGPTGLDLDLDPAGGRVVVAVTDTGPGSLRAGGPYKPGLPYGRGLDIVERLAARWGHDPVPDDGKTVWADLPAPPLTGPGAPGSPTRPSLP
ncbi:ATP-binding protein [Kitasatospora sp. NPDC051914]|uniref:ATP-binding protein n=1 Tax=Kitasatospora sp. NPDC051914 TaxID=3154945 RepID=UPI003435AA72